MGFRTSVIETACWDAHACVCARLCPGVAHACVTACGLNHLGFRHACRWPWSADCTFPEVRRALAEPTRLVGVARDWNPGLAYVGATEANIAPIRREAPRALM